MRTIRLFLLIILAMLVGKQAAHAQDHQWQKIKLGESTTVAFPERTEEKMLQGQQAFVVTSGSNTYIAMVQKAAFDPDPELAEQQKFYDGVLKGAMEQSGDARLVTKRTFEKNGFVGFEARFNTMLRTDSPRTLFMRFILVDGTLFMQNFITSVESAQESAADRNHFFESFQTDAHKTAYAEPGTRSQVYKLGKLMGSLFFYGASLAIVIVLIRRFSKSKKVAKV